MLFRRHILIKCVFLIYVSGCDTMDLIGFQIVKFRKNENISDMTVVLRNIPRSSKMAGLYFKKYASTFPYKTVNVTGNEAIFENLEFNLDWYMQERVMHSTILLQNNTQYLDTEVMAMELIEYSEEVPHACLKSCRIIIDYNETLSDTNVQDNPDASPKQDERYLERDVCSQLTSQNGEAKSSLLPKVDINPSTSIIFKPKTNHNISCIGDVSKYDFDIRLYQIKNGNNYIRAETKTNVLKTVLHLTEQDDGSSLQCYIMWKYCTKASKLTIDLILNNTADVMMTQDEGNSVSQATSPNAGSYWQNFGLVITTIIIIILLIIIIYMVIKTQRNRSQDQTNDDTREIQTNMEEWKSNDYYVNENQYVVGAYYSYASN